MDKSTCYFDNCEMEWGRERERKVEICDYFSFYGGRERERGV